MAARRRQCSAECRESCYSGLSGSSRRGSWRRLRGLSRRRSRVRVPSLPFTKALQVAPFLFPDRRASIRARRCGTVCGTVTAESGRRAEWFVSQPGPARGTQGCRRDGRFLNRVRWFDSGRGHSVKASGVQIGDVVQLAPRDESRPPAGIPSGVRAIASVEREVRRQRKRSRTLGNARNATRPFCRPSPTAYA
jgi:hypothetical protein